MNLRQPDARERCVRGVMTCHFDGDFEQIVRDNEMLPQAFAASGSVAPPNFSAFVWPLS